MAKADQIKSLIKSHLDNDKDRFMTIALQLAAHEARQGHGALATDIKTIIDHSKVTPLQVTSLTDELEELVELVNANRQFSELIISSSLSNRLKRVLKEYNQKEKLSHYGLTNRRKLLLCGEPGTGKTMTALVMASKLHIPCYTIQMDKLVTKYMGETSVKLRQIFKMIGKHRGIFLFDEFDAIGGDRGFDNDVAEMRRVLNSFLQFLEKDESQSIIIAATNNQQLLDKALFRRFDDILQYKLPESVEIEKLISNTLAAFIGRFDTKSCVKQALGLSHADISLACKDAIKEVILNDKKLVTKKILLSMLHDRRAAYLVR
jgi:SpoVK/Ycf46/Vps4 family AAA+-type ATPase